MNYYQVKNYKLGKDKFEGIQSVRIEKEDEVFFGQPMCLVEYGKEYKEPYLITQENSIPIVVEKVELVKRLATLKEFHLRTGENGMVEEVKKEEAELSIRLPKDTKIEDLEIREGSVFKIERNKETE